MTWGTLTVGTAAHAANTNTTTLKLPYPVVPAGNAIFLAVTSAAAELALTIIEPNGVTSVFSNAATRTNNATVFLYWKIANGTESGNLQLDVNANNDIIAQMAYAAGAPASVTGNVIAASSSGFAPNTGQGWPALTVTQDNCLIITLATKAANTSGYNTPSPWSNKLSEQQNNTGPQTMIWEYVIQAAQANITAGTYTITTDANASTSRVIAAFAPALPPPGMQLL